MVENQILKSTLSISSFPFDRIRLSPRQAPWIANEYGNDTLPPAPRFPPFRGIDLFFARGIATLSFLFFQTDYLGKSFLAVDFSHLGTINLFVIVHHPNH